MKISKRLLCALISVVIVACAAVIPVSAAQKKQVEKEETPKADYVEGEAIVVLRDSGQKLLCKVQGGVILRRRNFHERIVLD